MIPGIYSKLPMKQYLDLQAFSSGLGQRILAQSPLHAWTESPWNPDRARDDSGTADIGTFAHAMLLEGGADALVVVEAADWRTNAAKAEREAARAAGKLPILAHKVSEVKAMVKAAHEYIASSEIAGILTDGGPEQTAVFEADGVLCKVRPDRLGEYCLSYKTTAGSAQPDAWIRTQLPQYDLGIALYGRGTGKRVITLVQEQSAPFSCSLIGLDPAYQALAESKLDQALSMWKACLELGKFPAYPTRICWAEPKPWMLAEAEESELEGAFADPAKLWEKP